MSTMLHQLTLLAVAAADTAAPHTDAGTPIGGPVHSSEDASIAVVVKAAVLLISIASAVGLLTKLIRVPYTVALVLAGLGLALFKTPISGVHITENLVLMLFLPPLLFQAGLHLKLADLRREWVRILLLAVPGVVIVTSAAAVAIRFILPYALPPEYATWTTAFVLGAIIAPTDPISVVSIFGSLGVPHRLRVAVEGESLFNDGTAAALFTVLRTSVVAAVLASSNGEPVPDAPGVGLILTEFFRMAGIAVALGGGLGLGAFIILKKLDDHTLETGITVGLAWGSYLLAESFHASGVIATLTAALVIGSFGKSLAMSDTTRTTLTGFWDSIDFIINSMVFLLVGLEMSAPDVGGVSGLIRPNVLLGAAAVYTAILLARGVKVGLVAMLVAKDWPRGWNIVLWWAGLRGGLCLALGMGLPAGELRSYILPVVFLVVLATLLVQATSMSLVIRWVGIRADEKPDAAH